MSMRFAVLLISVAAYGTDVSGSWSLSYKTENGLVRQSKLTLKVEGGQLSGTLGSDRGTARIESGKVEEDSLAFDLVRKGNGDEITVHYQGKMENGALKLTMRYANHPPVEVTGTKL